MNDLSIHLNSSGIRGYLGTAFINHLCYVDDLCFISLPSSGMRQLLHVCNKYARNINGYIIDLSHFLYVL